MDYILEFSFIIFFCEKSKLQDQKLISEELWGVKKLSLIVLGKLCEFFLLITFFRKCRVYRITNGTLFVS